MYIYSCTPFGQFCLVIDIKKGKKRGGGEEQRKCLDLSRNFSLPPSIPLSLH